MSPSGDISYRFNPPSILVEEGVVKRETYGTDLKQVRKLVKQHNDNIDLWREEQLQIAKLYKGSKVTDLINYYYQSNDFNMLRDTTKVDYRYFLTVLHQSMGTRKYLNVTSKVAKQAYEEWVKRGIPFANHALLVPVGYTTTLFKWSTPHKILGLTSSVRLHLNVRWCGHMVR